MTLTWSFDVDWDRDNVYEANESAYMIDFSSHRGRQFFLSPSGKGFEHQSIGKAVVILDNFSGRFDPFNSSSPLSPNVRPGCFCRVRVTDGVDTYSVITGRIHNIQPISGGEKTVRITVHDGWQWLYDIQVDVLLQEDYDASQAITDVLSAASWPALWGSNLSTPADNYRYWWVDQISAATAINDIVDAELGSVIVASDGSLTYNSRHVILETAVSLDQNELLKEISMPMPWETVRNYVRVNAYPRVVQATSVLWTLQDTPLIDNGVTATYWGNYTYAGRSVPGKSIITPVATTDYTANTQADGGGVDLTADFSVAITKFGSTCKLDVTNSSGFAGYLTLLQVRGDAVDCPDITTLVEDKSGSDQPRNFVLDLLWQQDVNTAKQFALYLSDFMSVLKEYPVIQLEDQFAKQFGADLQDKVSLSIAKLGIDDYYKLGYIEHKWLHSNGQGIRTVYCLEPFIDPAGYWVFPISDFGNDTVFAL